MNTRAEHRIRRTLMRDGFSLEQANRAIAETRGFALADPPARRFAWRRWVWPVVVALLVTRLVLFTLLVVPYVLEDNSLGRSMAAAAGLVVLTEFFGFPLVTALPLLTVVSTGLIVNALADRRWWLALVGLAILVAVVVLVLVAVPMVATSLPYAVAAVVGALTGVALWLVLRWRSTSTAAA